MIISISIKLHQNNLLLLTSYMFRFELLAFSLFSSRSLIIRFHPKNFLTLQTFSLEVMTIMNKIVHIFRDGEVESQQGVIDPPLTSNGFEMATDLIYELPYSMKAPTLVLVSPLKRCIQTALLLFHLDFKSSTTMSCA